MGYPTIYPSGLLLQKPEVGTAVVPYSGLALVMVAGADLPLGTLVQVDPGDTDTVVALDAATPELLCGVVVGSAFNGKVDYNGSPLEGGRALIAIPPCRVGALLGASVSAGAVLMVDSTDGRVATWADGNVRLGYALAAGSDGDVVSVHLQPSVASTAIGASHVSTIEAGENLAIGDLVMLDVTDTSTVIKLDAATPELFYGVVTGTLVAGVPTEDPPGAADDAVIGLPSCVASVILDETVAAGANLMPASVDGRVVAWLPGNYMVGYAIEGGDQDDVVAAYITPVQRPYSGPVQHFIAGATIPVGALVEVEAATPTDIQPLDAASPYLFVGVVLGVMADGRIDSATAPTEGDIAAVAIPPCTVDVILDATIAAGVTLMPDAATDGRVDAWTDGNHMVGFTLEGGDQNDVVSAHIFPIKLFVNEP